MTELPTPSRISRASTAMQAAAASMWPRLATFPTTQGRIVVDIVCAVLYVVVCLTADIVGHPVGQGTQITIGAFISGMLGIGAVQFVAKRRTEFAPTMTETTPDSSTTITADDKEPKP